MSENPIKILSLDGGSTRGLLTARVLVEIEKITGKPIYSLFDYISGTSSGALIGAGLVSPKVSNNSKNEVPCTAQEIYEIFLEFSEKIFTQNMSSKLLSLFGVLGTYHDLQGNMEGLKDYVQDVKMKDVLTNFIVPAYDIEKRAPVYFSSSDPVLKHAPIFKVMQGSASIPAFFKPTQFSFKPPSGEVLEYNLVDGVLFAINPTMCAYTWAKRNHPDRNFYHISIGAGIDTKPIPYTKAKKWGYLGWLFPILGAILDGAIDNANFIAKDIYQSEGNTFIRLDKELPEDLEDARTVTEDSARNLIRLGDEFVKENYENLLKICAALEDN